MYASDHVTQASQLMLNFAECTGLDSGMPPQRYLWTDAFAVCNFLGLARITGESSYSDHALRLVDQVHHVLGQYRQDDPRTGWISGLAADEGEAHPTRGGLRIGKRLPERSPDAPFDERLEWDRDGQYFHYLTKWMHALDQVSRVSLQPQFNIWAQELAATAHDAFTYIPPPGRTPRMYWKMSTDLSRPLVASMGQHDPLEGYVTLLQLRATAEAFSQLHSSLDEASAQFAEMAEASDWISPDPLGIGGLLVDAWRAAQLMREMGTGDATLIERLLSAAHAGLQYYAASGELHAPADYRLAFRELGLATGLEAIRSMQRNPSEEYSGVQSQVDALMHYASLAKDIVSFWRDPVHQNTGVWSEHRNINEVMLATCLVPAGFSELILPNDHS